MGISSCIFQMKKPKPPGEEGTPKTTVPLWVGDIASLEAQPLHDQQGASQRPLSSVLSFLPPRSLAQFHDCFRLPLRYISLPTEL